MTDPITLVFAFFLYAILPLFGVYFGYIGLKKLTKPKVLEYNSMPKLNHIPEKKLPLDIQYALSALNDKGEKLRLLYGDTNRDGKIDDQDSVSETYVMINKLLDEHIPQAIHDYLDLLALGNNRTHQVTITNSNITGRQALIDILTTIDRQFDNFLDASYHQDGQKLLITNRYLRQRFDE